MRHISLNDQRRRLHNNGMSSVADVARIAAMENPVIRNLEITECYADLSAAMRASTGGAADWCTFATWASRQAGSTIRGEDLLDNLDRRLGRKRWLLAPLASLNRLLLRKGLFQPDTALGRIVAEIHSPFDAFERASAEVARGNLKVFEEIGREFARFMATVPVDAREDSDGVRGVRRRHSGRARRRTARTCCARRSPAISGSGRKPIPARAPHGSCWPT